jgi:hypothetical protein
MQTRVQASHSAAWLTQCMRDVKTQKIQQSIRPYASSSRGGAGCVLSVRGVVATSRIHRGEHIGTVKSECVLTGSSATELLQRACRGRSYASEAASSPQTTLQPLSAQTFDDVVRRISRLPLASAAPPHLLLSRDALLMTTALYMTRSPLHQGVLPSLHHPMMSWLAVLPRRPPPMGVLLRTHFTQEANFQPLPRRLRLSRQTRDVRDGDDVTAAATELMVQAVESGEVALTELHNPSLETALTPAVLTNYFHGRPSALTVRQHAAQRARTGAAETEEDAVHLFLEWERHLQTQLVDALLPVLLTAPDTPHPLPDHIIDSSAWREEEAALRWAHFMLRSRAANLHWRRPVPPLLSLIPLLDMLNHGTHKANVVYHCDDSGDVVLTASQTIPAGEELVLRYNHIGQRGCLFGDQPRQVSSSFSAEDDGRGRQSQGARAGRGGRTTAVVAREVEMIERRQYSDVYAHDEDEESVLNPGSMMVTSVPTAGGGGGLTTRTNSSQEQRVAELAHREMQQEVQWLWRYGFLRSTEEKNREAAQLWSRGLRRRIAHLTDVRRKGKPGEFVIGVPEGLQHLREQRAQLERERYANHRVFPPQQP